MKFKNYDNYEVYSDGRIWSYKTKKFLKPHTIKGGYQRVHLTDNNGNVKWHLLHRVVYEAVTGEPIPKGYEINHISEAKDENFFENLQLISHKDNINYGTRNSRVSKSLSKQVGAFKDGELIMTFPSAIEAGRNGFNQGAVSACCRGVKSYKTFKGFEWRYI